MLQTNRIKLLALVLLATACNGDGVGTEGPSWFRASVSGEVNREYQGRGVFASGPDDDVQTAPHFRIASDGEDVGMRQRFYLRWPDARRPAPGTYELVPHDDEYGSTRGVTAVYTWSQGDNVSSPASGELYVAAAGTVEITRSGPGEVEGTIRFSGIRIEKRDEWNYGGNESRHQPDPAAPRIEVAGTFRVTRFDEDAVVVRTSNRLQR